MEDTFSQSNMDIDSEQDFSQEEEDYSSLLERILSVHVIKSKLFGYLSAKDIKNTVLVSRYVVGHTNCFRKFKQALFFYQEMEGTCRGFLSVEVGHCQNAHSRPSKHRHFAAKSEIPTDRARTATH